MSRRPRWNHSPAFKAKVAIESLGEGNSGDDSGSSGRPVSSAPLPSRRSREWI